jgi:hypothetical protein
LLLAAVPETAAVLSMAPPAPAAAARPTLTMLALGTPTFVIVTPLPSKMVGCDEVGSNGGIGLPLLLLMLIPIGIIPAGAEIDGLKSEVELRRMCFSMVIGKKAIIKQGK